MSMLASYSCLIVIAGLTAACIVLLRLWRSSENAKEQMQIRANCTANHFALADDLGRVTWANAAFATLTGLEQADCVRQPVLKLLRATGSIVEFEQALNRQVSHRAELRCHAGEGSHWLDVELQPQFDHHGRLMGFTLLAIDVDARVGARIQREQALQDLAKERRRLDRILEGTRAGTWELDLLAGRVRVNDRWAAMLGYSVAELDPFDFARAIDMIHPDDRTAADDLLRRHLQGEVPHFEIEQRVQNKDGTWRWLMSMAMVTERGVGGERPIAVSGMHIDISRRKADEEELKLQRKKLSTVIASLPGVVFECELSSSDQYRFPYISDSLLPMFGLEAASVMADAEVLFRAIDSEDRASLRKAVAVSAVELTPLRHDLRIIGTKGEVWVGLHSLPQRHADGSVIWHGMLLDISIRKQLDGQLEKTTARAEEANRAKSAFLAAMSHEIRTPMNGVVGIAELMAHTRDPDEQLEAARMIRESSLSLLRIVDDILDFSKIEAGRIEIERVSLDLTSLLEGVCDALTAPDSARPVTLRLFIDPALPQRIWGDPTRLRQVLNNLVGNAMKFSRHGDARQSRVAVRLAPSERDPLQMRLTVEDNGIGMSAEMLERTFSPFTQGEASTTRRFGGTGLGLAITHRLVEVMHGSIEVVSELDVGSNFTVTLPLEPIADQPHAENPPLVGLHCITLADSAGEHDDLRAYLEPTGITVHAAADIGAALALATTLPQPVVLVHDRGELPSGDQLRTDFPGVRLRHLLVARGRRIPANAQAAGILRLGCLRRQDLQSGLAMLSGRASSHMSSAQLTSPHDGGLAARLSPAGRELILVAEDDAVNQHVILHQLKFLGYAAEVAGDGLQALALWRSGRFSMLLTDLHMPAMDGYALVSHLRAEESIDGPRHPVLALTANVLQEEVILAQAAGVDECLTKPVPLALLKSSLEHWLINEQAVREKPPSPDALGAG